MNKSPGHQKWPEHKVLETPVAQRVTVELDGQIVADSSGSFASMRMAAPRGITSRAAM